MNDNQNIDIAEVQGLFSFAWDHTAYRANIVALRTALGLRGEIILPCDASTQLVVREIEEGLSIKAGFSGNPQDQR
jgi:hypothetical protein